MSWPDLSTDERFAYWRRVLDDAPIVELPVDPPRASRTERGSVRVETLAASSIQLTAAAVAVLVARYRRAIDLVVGIAGEQDEDVLPIRLRLARMDTAKEWVARVDALTAEGRRHAMPLREIVKACGGASPLRIAIATPRQALPDVPIVVRVAVGAITIEYDRAYERATIVRMAQALSVLVEEMTHRSDQPLGVLRLLREEDEHELVALGSGLSVRPPFVPMDARVREWAERQPDALAIRDDGGALSYKEYFDRASRLASWILRRSHERNGRVGIYVERSANLMVAELASWIAGHACVPFDARTPPARVAELLAECGASVVLCSPATAKGLEVPCAVGVFGGELDSELRAEPPAPVHAWQPLEVAYIIFTSGSTGRPKGVRVPHGSFSTFIAYDIKTMKIGPGDRVVQMISPGFDSTMEEIWRALAAGAAVLVVDDDLPLSPRNFVRYLRDEGITHAGMAANLFEASVDEDWTNTKLRRLGTGVEKMPPFTKKFSFPVAHGYGPTETTIGATETLDIREIEGPAPIGRPLDDVRVYLLDDDLQLLPWGAMGELFIGGELVTLGYLDPQLTAASFLPDPFAGSGARMYRTGDVVRWRPDGLLQFHGRVDAQLKLRGHRIEPGEIEAALVEHPHVAEAAALQVEAQAGPRLVAFVVPKPGQTLLAEPLLAILRKKLPPYMVPSAILFLDALPRTTNSKTDRAALAALAARSVRTSGVAPRTPDEAVVAKVFGAVLGVDSVGALDDFFALGGHSLLATKVVTSLHREIGIDLLVRVVFEAPTVAALAREVDRVRRSGPEAVSDREGEPPGIVHRAADAETVASLGQEDIASFERSRGPSPVFLLDTRLAVSGRVDLAAISAAVRSALQRHDALRTRVDVRGRRTKVTLAKAQEVPVQIVDVRGSDDPAAEATRIAEAARTPFSLAGEIPAKVLIARLADDRAHVALLTHHILADHPSLGIFARSFTAAYERALSGQDCSLEPPPVSYSDFAQWEREWFMRDGIRRLERVRRRLIDVPPIEFPSERPRGAMLSLDAHEGSRTLGGRDLEAIMGVAKAESVTPYMLFLVAVGALVRGYTGATRVPVGGPTDTRHSRPELAQLAGRFLNVFTCVVDVDGDPTVDELLARVRPAALDALDHRDVPTWYALGSESSYDCELNRLMLNGPTFWPEPQPILSREGLSVTFEPLRVLDGGRARNELILSAWASDDELTLAARGASSLFDPERTQRIADAFGRILCACKPTTRLSELLTLCE